MLNRSCADRAKAQHSRRAACPIEEVFGRTGTDGDGTHGDRRNVPAALTSWGGRGQTERSRGAKPPGQTNIPRSYVQLQSRCRLPGTYPGASVHTIFRRLQFPPRQERISGRKGFFSPRMLCWHGACRRSASQTRRSGFESRLPRHRIANLRRICHPRLSAIGANQPTRSTSRRFENRSGTA
jgi:hypothetical protein